MQPASYNTGTQSYGKNMWRVLTESTWKCCTRRDQWTWFKPQNHRMVWVGRDLTDELVPSPLPWAGTLSTRARCSKPRPTWPWSHLKHNGSPPKLLVPKISANYLEVNLQNQLLWFETAPLKLPAAGCLCEVEALLSSLSEVGATLSRALVRSWARLWRHLCSTNAT